MVRTAHAADVCILLGMLAERVKKMSVVEQLSEMRVAHCAGSWL